MKSSDLYDPRGTFTKYKLYFSTLSLDFTVCQFLLTFNLNGHTFVVFRKDRSNTLLKIFPTTRRASYPSSPDLWVRVFTRF